VLIEGNQCRDRSPKAHQAQRRSRADDHYTGANRENFTSFDDHARPAGKAIARAVAAARSKLGKKTLQRTTPVAAHQSNGEAERAVQTVRRLETCLFHALELPADTL
ncbi:hypothetical protein AK812_SmicGene38337, partial [Symbiodinium microadriaticum]